ncbi:MAG: hypothetical protein ACJASM_002760 [Salibacteraceae bacterium]|jgi:hypothetical protein
MGIIILPWQMMCTAHPFGHHHHKHDGPSPCEIRRMVLQQPGKQLLPPMYCNHISDATDDYKQIQVEKIVPPIQLVAVASILFDLVNFKIPKQPFLIPAEANCRSATLLSDSPLRAPPFSLILFLTDWKSFYSLSNKKGFCVYACFIGL